MPKHEKGIALVVVIFVGFFIWGIVSLVKSKEGYKQCICSSRMGRDSNCQDIELVQKLYDEGKLTEYSTLKNPGWSKVSPGSYSYPHSTGCPWEDKVTDNKDWRQWDFTEFVG